MGILPAMDLADAGMTGGVLQDHQVAGEARRVRAGQGHQHAVVSRDGDDLHFGYHRHFHQMSPQFSDASFSW